MTQPGNPLRNLSASSSPSPILLHQMCILSLIGRFQNQWGISCGMRWF
jgi:hypothetical protein